MAEGNEAGHEAGHTAGHELADDVVVAVEDGEAFLLDVPTGRYFGLNRAGLVVWESLGRGVDPLEALRVAFPAVAPAVLRADADALLDQLREAGLVRATRPG